MVIDVESIPCKKHNPEQLAIYKEAKDLFIKFSKTLTKKQRIAIREIFINGSTFAETAKQLDTTVHAVKNIAKTGVRLWMKTYERNEKGYLTPKDLRPRPKKKFITVYEYYDPMEEIEGWPFDELEELIEEIEGWPGYD